MTGGEFFSHPVAVAEILIENGFHDDCIVTALLHDTVEDVEGVEVADIEREFGTDIAKLVDSVTKLTKQARREDKKENISLADSDQKRMAAGIETKKSGEANRQLAAEEKAARAAEKAEAVRHYIINMARDERALAVKLADRLHNLRTIGATPKDKQRGKAEETLSIYAPLAERFGLYLWREELEDLSFKVLHPKERYMVNRMYAAKRGSRNNRTEEYVAAQKFKQDLKDFLKKHHFIAEVRDRVKPKYSAWRKTQEMGTGTDIGTVFDVYGFQIIIDDVHPFYYLSGPSGENSDSVCSKPNANEKHTTLPPDDSKMIGEVYRALGLIHYRWPGHPEFFKDYITSPKKNGYKALHTKLTIERVGFVEVQIKSRLMALIAEYGSAAHWAYKDNARIAPKLKSDFATRIEQLAKISSEDKQELTKQLFAMHISDDKIVCFTKDAQYVELPKGATALDFAYYIHEVIGHEAVGALVNNKKVALNKVLRNGHQVEILRKKGIEITPQRSEHVTTKKAADYIRRAVGRKEQVFWQNLGKRAVKKIFDAYSEELSEERQARAASMLGFANAHDMIVHLGKCVHAGVEERHNSVDTNGIGKVISGEDIFRLACPERARRLGGDPKNRLESDASIWIDRTRVYRDCLRADCCLPLPGEIMVALRGRDKNYVLHSIVCDQLRNEGAADREWFEASWNTGAGEREYEAGLRLRLRNEKGALNKITGLISGQNSNISDLLFLKRNVLEFEMLIEVQVRDNTHMTNIIDAIRDDKKNTVRVERCRDVKAIKAKYRRN